jgi:hypothetical protein
LDVAAWSLAELNVPPYPARRAYLQIARKLGEGAAVPSDCILVIAERPPYHSAERAETRIESGW